jgi:HSP20 family protein
MTTSLTRWSPASELFRGRFNRFFDESFLRDFFAPLESGETLSQRAWVPAVDIRETAESLVLTAELPGLSRDDVDITLENSVLTLRGERKFERDENQGNYHRIERSYGTFSRSFTLPANVQGEAVKASFENGVLTVEIPKREESRPRKIAIK